MQLKYNIEGGNFNKAGFAASELKKVLKQLNIDFKIIRRTIIGVYEAEVNIVAHANSGYIEVSISDERLNITAQDTGPGIADINLAMQEGFSTASQNVREMGFGAGMGLPNIKKNSDSFHICSTPGKGVTVNIVNYIKEKVNV